MTRDPAQASAGLSRQAFERLLARLDPDPALAAALYNRHRERVIRYFGWQGCLDAEALADDVMDRAARRLNQGEKIERPGPYLLGIARFVVLEQQQRAEQQRVAFREYQRQQGVAESEPAETAAALSCLDGCLEALAPDRRTLILEYYGGAGTERLRGRQALGARLGLLPGALRNRALRIRQELEDCVDKCRRRTGVRDVHGRSVTTGSAGDGHNPRV